MRSWFHCQPSASLRCTSRDTTLVVLALEDYPFRECVLVILRKATIEDSDLLLAWRNDDATRINSLNSAPIQPDEHARWLDCSIRSADRSLFIIEESGTPVGTVRIDSLPDGQKDLSWTIAPERRGSGIGKQAVQKAIDEHPDWVFVARIKTTNAASIRIAEHAGFHLRREENGVLFFSTYRR
jgi:RimJ/RimL family protein N-acetyltransferase